MKGYFANEQFCQYADEGIDREGLFRLICMINDIECPENIFVTTMHTEVDAEKTTGDWVAVLKEMQSFTPEEVKVVQPNIKWPDQGLTEVWPKDKEIRLQKIYYARIIGEHNLPLLGIQLQFTNGIKSPMISSKDLDNEEYKGRVQIVACDTDFSKHRVGKVGFLVQDGNQYLAMKVWDTSNALIN